MSSRHTYYQERDDALQYLLGYNNENLAWIPYVGMCK